MSGNAALLLRVGFSFSLVLGLMWIAARVLRNKTAGRPTDTVEVLARTQLGRGSSVAVLRVGDHALVLGVTERGITQLGEPITDLAGLRGRTIKSVLAPADDANAAADVYLRDDISSAQALAFEDVLASVQAEPTVRRRQIPVARKPRHHASHTRRAAAPSAPQATAGQGALTGSILSPATWRMGMDALRERTVRRG